MIRFFPKFARFTGSRTPTAPALSYTISSAGRTAIHDDGAVFFHLDTGVLFKSNQVGARIWKGVLNHDSPATIISQISSEYGIAESQAAEDAVQFLAELEAEGFVTGVGR